MVLISTLSSRFNKRIAPFFLRHGLTLRHKLARGVIRDSPRLDGILLLPFLQTVISIEVREDVRRKQLEELKEIQKKIDGPSKVDKLVDEFWEKYIVPFKGEEKEDNVTMNPTQHTSGYNSNKPTNTKHSNKEPNKKPKEPQPLRLQVLESYIRPVLFPNNKWNDVKRWRFHNRFTKWLRTEFLLAQHGTQLGKALKKCPSLAQAPLFQKTKRRDSILKWIPGGGSLNPSSNNNNVTYPSSPSMVGLPHKSDLVQAFQMKHWSRTKNRQAEYRTMERITQQLGGELVALPVSWNLKWPNLDNDQDISHLTLEELLELSGCHVASCGPLNALCEEGNVFEFWTKNYIMGLAAYLLDRCEEFEGDTIIVDVGAGDGTLSHFVHVFMEELKMWKGKDLAKMHRRHPDRQRRTKSAGKSRKSSVKSKSRFHVVATDDGSWNIPQRGSVEKLSVEETMNKYGAFLPSLGSRDGPDNNQAEDDTNTMHRTHQLIVLCSWMPMQEDWTKDMRSIQGGADEYILIGESDDGNCGHNWYTWGNIEYYDFKSLSDDELLNLNDEPIPLYQLDGYERIDLDDLSKLQFSRFDSIDSSVGCTVSFRRN